MVGPGHMKKSLSVLKVSKPVSYLESFWYQRSLRNQLIEKPHESDKLLILQHTPVYTLGRRSKVKDLLFLKDISISSNDIFNLSKINISKSTSHQIKILNDTFNDELRYKKIPFEVYRVDRGGEITFHCPGQVVFYLVFNLENHKKDLHWFLRRIENLIINILRDKFNLDPVLHDKYTGVWVGQNKIASIGLSASKWITMHGFSLNIDFDLSAFSKIIPCGISDTGLGVTSLQSLFPQNSLSNVEIENLLLHSLIKEFNFSQVSVTEQSKLT